jgi:AraC-like DNA-binding protein
VNIVQKIHVILLGPFAGSATVSAVKTMKFQNVSPSTFTNGDHVDVPSAARVATATKPCRAAKASPLPPNKISQTNPLHAIAQELALARPSAEEPRADRLFRREFPFEIKTYVVSSGANRTLKDGQNCLALFIPLSGSLRVEIGRRLADLCAGEILIAPDPSRVVMQPLEETRVQVLGISFLPRFVYSLGSPSHDYFFLLPFYANYGLRPPIVGEGPDLRGVHQIIARLVQCYLERKDYFEVGCKALFLELLYFIAQHFRDAEWIQSEMVFQTAQAPRLAPVLEFVEANYAEPITLKEAAYLTKMSVPQFVRLFKRVAGMSFVTYLIHVRLSRSVRLLKESSLTIAQIACETGFSDQSYFDRRFKEAFGHTPRDFRRNFRSSGVNGKDRRSFSQSYNVQELGIRRAILRTASRQPDLARMKPIAAVSRLNHHRASVTCP